MSIKIVKNGLLCAVEGIDGAGKSSLVAFLASYLHEQKFSVVMTKEPGGTTLGKQLRSLLAHPTTAIDPRAEFLLYAADRAQHFAQVVLPALAAGSIVISDRLADSSLAYQGYGRGLDRRLIIDVNRWIMHDRMPDVIFYLRIDYTTAIQRITQRKEKTTVIEREEEQFFKRVIEGYEDIYKNRPNVIVLDARQTATTVHQNALKQLNQFIPIESLGEIL